ncbi:MAG: hypothetical protein FJX67_02945, partial [Alphaproteobacteria bacterium]|nr:hypothetical protein [Alphaproteobacteria bacterium]
MHALHPLSAVRLRNDGDIALLAGLITLYEAGGATDTAHVGDARIATLPVGEERLVSFALDQRTRIDRESRQSEQIAKGKIAGGLLELTILDRQTTVYRVRTAMREPRTVVVEQRRVAGWTIAEPDAKEVQLSPTHLRIVRTVPPSGETAFNVTLERPRSQEIALLSQNADQLLALSRRGASMRGSSRRSGAAPSSAAPSTSAKLRSPRSRPYARRSSTNRRRSATTSPACRRTAICTGATSPGSTSRRTSSTSSAPPPRPSAAASTPPPRRSAIMSSARASRLLKKSIGTSLLGWRRGRRDRWFLPARRLIGGGIAAPSCH